MSKAVVFLIPSLLDENGLAAIPSYIADIVTQCHVFFVENERSARRYLKKIRREIVIDDYEWYDLSDISRMSDTSEVSVTFRQKIREEKNIIYNSCFFFFYLLFSLPPLLYL